MGYIRGKRRLLCWILIFLGILWILSWSYWQAFSWINDDTLYWQDLFPFLLGLWLLWEPKTNRSSARIHKANAHTATR